MQDSLFIGKKVKSNLRISNLECELKYKIEIKNRKNIISHSPKEINLNRDILFRVNEIQRRLNTELDKEAKRKNKNNKLYKYFKVFHGISSDKNNKKKSKKNSVNNKNKNNKRQLKLTYFFN